jgi:hypothetical protein
VPQKIKMVTMTMNRRVTFDVLVPEEEYRLQYNCLKDRYGRMWVESWPEQTDPQKFVYEEIGIAAYLLCVWRLERAADPDKWRDPATGEERLQVSRALVLCLSASLPLCVHACVAIVGLEGCGGWGGCYRPANTTGALPALLGAQC